MTSIATPSARIAHVLFLDLVGYSRETTSVQSRRMEQLNAVVAASPAFAAAKSADAVQPLPTGDGMALVFFNDVLAPVQTAVEISRALRAANLPLRMGIHSGLVLPQMDAAGHENLVGEGINTAQRVMDFGDAGHILLSAQYATWLQHFDEWAAALHPLGQGTTKHNLILSLYSLHGDDFGLASPPAKLIKPAKGVASPAAQVVSPGKSVALLYKPNSQPDENVLMTLEARLRSLGHDVFVDNQTKISAPWAKAVEEPIRQADAVIAIVSPLSLRSEMFEYEIETAHDQFVRAGKPVLLPVRIRIDDPLEGTVASILQPLHFFTWNGPEDDEKLVAELLSAITEPLKPRAEEAKLEPVGGAVPPESPFYVRRVCDAVFLQALDAQESILLVKGARQIGKTSLLAQGTKRSRDSGRRVAMTDFQKFNTTQMASDDTFYRLLAATLARQLKFSYDFTDNWDAIFGAGLNMENFLRDLLEAADAPLVWFMDEVDKLFAAPFASDFFGLVRSWHNSRSTEPDGPWRNLTIVIAYATEAHLFIQDLNQSPFNVGRRLNLEDFNLQQTIDLNGRYGGPLTSYAETEALHALVGGQPFLTRCALDALATKRETLPLLLEHAAADDGPFNDHLKRILISVSHLSEVSDYVRCVLAGSALPHQDAYYRLLSAGIVRQNAEGAVVFRCELYRRYLQRFLSM
jgi:hypothetical protein